MPEDNRQDLIFCELKSKSKMSIILKLSFLFVFAASSAVNAQSNGTIVKFTIEGTNKTDLHPYNSNDKIRQLEERVYKKTVDKLKEKYSLEEITTVQTPLIIRKTGLNRFKGVKKLNKKEIQKAKSSDLSFKIKCDIAFNDNAVAKILINETAKRTVLYLSVGVFRNQELIEILKVKEKSSHTFLGEATGVHLSTVDFEYIYSEALNKIKLNDNNERRK